MDVVESTAAQLVQLAVEALKSGKKKVGWRRRTRMSGLGGWVDAWAGGRARAQRAGERVAGWGRPLEGSRRAWRGAARPPLWCCPVGRLRRCGRGWLSGEHAGAEDEAGRRSGRARRTGCSPACLHALLPTHR